MLGGVPLTMPVLKPVPDEAEAPPSLRRLRLEGATRSAYFRAHHTFSTAPYGRAYDTGFAVLQMSPPLRSGL